MVLVFCPRNGENDEPFYQLRPGSPQLIGQTSICSNMRRWESGRRFLRPYCFTRSIIRRSGMKNRYRSHHSKSAHSCRSKPAETGNVVYTPHEVRLLSMQLKMMQTRAQAYHRMVNTVYQVELMHGINVVSPCCLMK